MEIMEKYIGKTIEVVNYNPEALKKKKAEIEEGVEKENKEIDRKNKKKALIFEPIEILSIICFTVSLVWLIVLIATEDKTLIKVPLLMLSTVVFGIITIVFILCFKYEDKRLQIYYPNSVDFHLAVEENKLLHVKINAILKCGCQVLVVTEDTEHIVHEETIIFKTARRTDIKDPVLDIEKELVYFPYESSHANEPEEEQK